MGRMVETVHRLYNVRRRHGQGHPAVRGPHFASGVVMAGPEAKSGCQQAPVQNLVVSSVAAEPPAEGVAVAASGQKLVQASSPGGGADPDQAARFLKVDQQSLERYRLVFGQLQLEVDLGRKQCIAVASPPGCPDRTAVAINLAVAAAEAGRRRLLLLEGDLHRPILTERLGVPRAPGLSEILIDGLRPAEAIRWLTPLGYWVLGGGGRPRQGRNLLGSRRMGVLVADLKQMFDLIIVHSGDLRHRVAADLIGQFFDAVVLAVPMHRVRRQVVDRIVARLREAGAKLRGCILTGAETPSP